MPHFIFSVVVKRHHGQGRLEKGREKEGIFQSHSLEFSMESDLRPEAGR